MNTKQSNYSHNQMAIYDEYVIFFELDKPDNFKIKPLEMVMRGDPF
jgi:hypothetical protein